MDKKRNEDFYKAKEKIKRINKVNEIHEGYFFRILPFFSIVIFKLLFPTAYSWILSVFYTLNINELFNLRNPLGLIVFFGIIGVVYISNKMTIEVAYNDENKDYDDKKFTKYIINLSTILVILLFMFLNFTTI